MHTCINGKLLEQLLTQFLIQLGLTLGKNETTALTEVVFTLCFYPEKARVVKCVSEGEWSQYRLADCEVLLESLGDFAPMIRALITQYGLNQFEKAVNRMMSTVKEEFIALYAPNINSVVWVKKQGPLLWVETA